MNDLEPLVPLTVLHTIGDVILGKGEVCLVAGKGGVGGDVKYNRDLLEHHGHNHGSHKHLIRLIMLEGDRLSRWVNFSPLIVVHNGSCSVSFIGIENRFLKGLSPIDLIASS